MVSLLYADFTNFGQNVVAQWHSSTFSCRNAKRLPSHDGPKQTVRNHGVPEESCCDHAVPDESDCDHAVPEESECDESAAPAGHIGGLE
jgi:hypothetical protein